MPSYSELSQERLYSCDPKLIKVFTKVIRYWDNSILCGYRNKEEQDKAFHSVPQRSKLMFPESGHNKLPSIAIDSAPYGCWGPHKPKIVWPQYPNREHFIDDGVFITALNEYHKDMDVWYYYAGFVLGVAADMGISLIHGADWNQNRRINDQNFCDLPHFQLRE